MDLSAVELVTLAHAENRRLPSAGLPDPTGASTDQFDARMRKVERLTEQLVASTFLVPLLNRMQNDPFRSDLMHGGFAEDVFQSQLNTQWADGMARSMNLPITRRLKEQFAQRISDDPQRHPQLRTGHPPRRRRWLPD